MTELRNILDQAIQFYERYPAEIENTLGTETNDEFWSLEEKESWREVGRSKGYFLFWGGFLSFGLE